MKLPSSLFRIDVSTITQLVFFLVFAMSTTARSTTYFSQGNADALLLSSWNTSRSGGGTIPGNFSSGDTFVIQNGDTLTTSAPWALSGLGNKIDIESGGMLIATFLVTAENFQIDNGGRYIHNVASTLANGDAADIPGFVSRTFADSSTVEIQKWANGGTTPVALASGTSWGNLIINLSDSLAGSWQQNGALTTIKGDFTLVRTGSPHSYTRYLRLTGNAPYTLTIGGDLKLAGGNLNLASGTGSGAAMTVSIGGNSLLSDGIFVSSSTTQFPKVLFTGGRPSVSFFQMGGVLNGGNVDWEIAASKNVLFGAGVSVSSGRGFTVNGTLKFTVGPSYISGPGNFTLAAGTTLGIASINGISSGTTLGNIRVLGVRTFSPGANYEFVGTAPQVTGNGFPLLVNDLTISNSGGVSMSRNVVIADKVILHKSLTMPLGDTLFITNTASSAVEDTGKILQGTISRQIAPGSTDVYRFESPLSFVQFDGGGTYPSVLAVTAVPDSMPAPTPVAWEGFNGALDTAQNTITVDSVKQFSTWSFGTITQPPSGTPKVKRYYDIRADGGTGFRAKLQLRYAAGEVMSGTTESTLRLLRRGLLVDSLFGRWNLLSLPLVPYDDLKGSLFPTASSKAFGYVNGSYRSEDHLKPGLGYWLKFPRDTQVTLVGEEFLRDTVAVIAGWNMIGALSITVPVSSVASIPPGIVRSHFFDYAGAYRVADTLVPLRGYWVKVDTAGQLIITAPTFPAQPTKLASSMFNTEEVNRLMVRDARGNEECLYFAVNGDLDARRFVMPPIPPAGSFDARFSSNRMLEVIGSGQSGEFQVRISDALYPVTIGWEIKQQSAIATLEIADQEIHLMHTGFTRILSPASKVRLKLSDSPTTPQTFTLQQNYPNPFNPSTIIKYALPTNSRVVLMVFNTLGQEVLSLVNETQQAGYKSVTFDARRLSSGLYFYRLVATDASGKTFQSVKKMLLLR